MPTVVPDDGFAFHASANVALGCQQVAPLFAPHSCRHFTTNFFEHGHLITRNTGLSGLLTSAGLYRAASQWQFKVAVDHAQARLLAPDSFAHDSSYADGSLLDGPGMDAALYANRTVVLHNMELYWQPVSQLCLALMRAFGVYAQANVYRSPSGLPSAVHAHQDAQSVFVVQCEGRKRWALFEPPQRWRLRYNQRGKAGDVAPANELLQPVAEYTLAPGDVLFVPRGMYHRTSTLDQGPSSTEHHPASGARPAPPSLHVTVGVETDTDAFTWVALLRDAATALGVPDATAMLDAALWEDERLREALPLPLCRFGGTFETAEPLGAQWFGHARELLAVHVNWRPKGDGEPLRRALDHELHKRQDLVEQKRLQILEFIEIGVRDARQQEG